MPEFKIKVFITGMTGCGKSTFGKKVSELVGLKFYDLDNEITKRELMSVNEIFEKHGEEYFRNIETRVLKQLALANESFIMATGGGTPCFADNIEFMNLNGITIYINASVKDVLERLSKKGINKRPLLKNLTHEELANHLAQQLLNRKRFYEKCKYSLAYNNSLETEIASLIHTVQASKQKSKSHNK